MDMSTNKSTNIYILHIHTFHIRHAKNKYINKSQMLEID